MNVFKQTSDLPYTRNWYKVWCVDGSVKILQDYEDVLTAWWNSEEYIDIIEVIDGKRSKSSGSGFRS